jgi:flagellar biogenesis protein FliO
MTDNASFLLVIIIAMMGGAALLAHRKQIRATGDGEDLTLEVARSIRLGAKLQLSLVRVPGRLLVVGATDKGVELLTELFPGDEEDVDDSFLASAFAKREEASERGHQAIQREELLPEPIMAPRHTPLTPEPVAEPRIERKTKPRRPVSSDVGKRTVVDSVGVYSRPGKRVQRDEPTPAPRAHRAATKTADHDDAFLDSMLERLSNARPAVAERSSRQQTKTDERAALRARVKQYRRGPTRL